MVNIEYTFIYNERTTIPNIVCRCRCVKEKAGSKQ